MALTAFQRDLCRLIARQRIERGESYIAGGAAMSAVLGSTRLSRDIDIFHDTAEAVAATAQQDRDAIERAGFEVQVERAREGYVEAVVLGRDERVVIQWTADSAFRFFPLVEHDELGLTLHPFDLATNKVLALVGRLEARDWVDIIYCHDRVQPLGYLAWAATGKDPGFSPASILEQAARSSRYSAVEIAELGFASTPPDAAALSQRWQSMLRDARELISILPAEMVGTCVLDSEHRPFAGDAGQLRDALDADVLRFHQGSIRGALPHIRQ